MCCFVGWTIRPKSKYKRQEEFYFLFYVQNVKATDSYFCLMPSSVTSFLYISRKMSEQNIEMWHIEPEEYVQHHTSKSDGKEEEAFLLKYICLSHSVSVFLQKWAVKKKNKF